MKRKYKGRECSPFILAAHDGNVEGVRILLSEPGMDMNQKEKYGGTALMGASVSGHIDVLNLLVQQNILELVFNI